MGELRKSAVIKADFKEFGVQRFVLIVRGAIHGKDERLSLRSPGHVGATKIAGARAVGKIARG